MPSQTNRTALRQLEKTEFLIVSGRTQKPTVNERLAKLQPELIGEGTAEAPGPSPDWNQLQEWGIAALEKSATELRASGRALSKSRVRLEKARKDRNAQLERISTAHRALRRSFTGTYGVDSLALVGLDAEPARALLAVREQMREAVTRMRDPQLAAALPEPVAGQLAIDLEAVADARDGEIGSLETKMGEIDSLRKQTDEALVERDAELGQNRRVYANVGRLLEGVYRLAGLDELAERIRPSERSPRKKAEEVANGRTSEPSGQTAKPSDEPSSGEPSEPSDADAPAVEPAPDPAGPGSEPAVEGGDPA